MTETVDHKIIFDSKNNQIIIPNDYLNVRDHKIYVPVQLIRKALPLPDKLEDKLEWLDQILHEIKKDKLVNLKTYLLEVARLARGQEGVREEARKITDKVSVERVKLIAKSWVDEKNILKEARLAFRLLKFEEEDVELLRIKVKAGMA